MNKSDLRKTAVGFLLGWTLVTASLNIPGLPVQWVVLAIALMSFGCAVYYAWSPTKAKSRVTGQASIFVVFGCVSLLLAGVTWLAPIPQPSLIVSVGLLAGGLIGSGVLWLIQRHINNPKSQS